MNRARLKKLQGRIPPALRSNLALCLRNGSVGILPTDTLYGVVGSAFSRKAVSRIYHLKERSSKKPFIILLSSLNDLREFGVILNKEEKKIVTSVWPGPVSLVLRVSSKKFDYLKRGERGLAFRLPRPSWLRDFLAASGPLVAPSANKEGRSPARNVREARRYFGDGVDFYVSAGNLISQPSTLISLLGKRPAVLREGAFHGTLYLSSWRKK